MTREELKEQIDELMRQYADEEIDGATYAQKMMELTSSAQNDKRYEICYVCGQCTHEAKCIRASACDIFRGAVTFAYGS